METNRYCPGCQKPLAADAPMGLCPACLAKAGFQTGGEQNAGFEPPPVEQIAKSFPQFEILGFIGRGGMGAVYQARQRTLDRLVALKILSPAHAGDAGFAERFSREARALARLNHPNIVAVHDFGAADEMNYLVLEFVDGANLREVVRAGRLAPAEALRIVPQICDALQFAHGEGVVHRDIKPENILLDKRGRVKITDFGIARVVGAQTEAVRLTGARDLVGTPQYMAPEQLENPQSVDHRADIFSLGVVFYELLTGELPLGKFAPPSRKVQVDVRLDDVVLRTLEKEPERRYQQAAAIKRDVETISSAPPKLPPPPAPAPMKVQTPVKKNTWVVPVVVMAAVFGLVMLLALAVAGYFLVRPTAGKRTGAIAPAANASPNARPVFPSTNRNVLPTLSNDERSRLLMDIRSANDVQKRLAMGRLAMVQPSEPRADIARTLEDNLTDPEWPTRQYAARALVTWADTNSVTRLIQTLQDEMFSVRWAAIEALGRLKDPRAIEPLAALLTDPACASRAGDALRAIGAPAEDAVLRVLQARDFNRRYEACRILKDIGTEKSLPALQSAVISDDGVLAMLARDAIKDINARGQKQ